MNEINKEKGKNDNGGKETMVNLDFNFDAWSETYHKYQTNKKGMQFVAELMFDENGRMKIHMISIDEKYRKFADNMTKIMVSITQGAVQYIANVFRAHYAFTADDYQVEQTKLENNAKEKLQIYLKVLFDQGIDAFVSTVLAQHQLYQTEYLLKNIELTEFGWTMANGDRWDGYNFMNDSGVCNSGNIGFDKLFQDIVEDTGSFSFEKTQQNQFNNCSSAKSSAQGVQAAGPVPAA